MPRNKAIYVGVLVVAASALLYIGDRLSAPSSGFCPGRRASALR
jgi:hypothetical protein